jgi:hypothetical protein
MGFQVFRVRKAYLLKDRESLFYMTLLIECLGMH